MRVLGRGGCRNHVSLRATDETAPVTAASGAPTPKGASLKLRPRLWHTRSA
jgi:hypothetical protein